MLTTHNSVTAAPLADAESVQGRLTGYVSDVAKWCASRRLQLNADTTETIWFGLHSNLAELQRINQSLQVRPSNIQPSSVVHDQGIYLDLELIMKQHIAKTTVACFYYIRCRGSARKLHSSW